MRKVQRNASIAMTFTVILTFAVSFVKPSTFLGRVVESFDAVPMNLPGWSGRNIDASGYQASVPNSSILMRDYANKEGRIANLTIVYGMDVSDIHNPQYCFEGQGWKEVSGRTVTVEPPGGRSHPAKSLLMDDSYGGWVLAIYWFAGQDGATDDLAGQRIRVWKSAIVSRSIQPSAVVRIIVPVTDGEVTAMRDAMSLASALDGPVMWMVRQKPKIVRAERVMGE